MQRAVRIKEGVGAVGVEQRLIGVHSRTVDAEDRFGHEGRVQTVLGGDGADNPLESHGVVCGGQRVGVLEVDLVLALGNLVMRSLDLKAHRFQGLDDLAAAVDTAVVRLNIKITGHIAGLGGGAAFFISLKQEELGLGAHVHGVAHGLSLGQDALQVVARAARERGAVRVVHVADDAGGVGAILVPPRQHGESVVVRLQVHVRLVDADEAVNRGAVEHHLAVQSLFNLAQRHGDILHEAENINELKAEEVNILLLNDLHDLFAGHLLCLLVLDE